MGKIYNIASLTLSMWRQGEEEIDGGGDEEMFPAEGEIMEEWRKGERKQALACRELPQGNG